MLYVNFFSESGALLETAPLGDASMPVQLPANAKAVIAGLLTSDEIAAALARLFLGGATAGCRGRSRNHGIRPDLLRCSRIQRR